MSSFLCDARHFVFSLLCVFQPGTFPPSRDCGLSHLSTSCWFSLFLSRPSATMVACGRVLMLVSLVLAPVFSFNSPCFISPPPATLAVRGRVLTVVCYVIAPFSSRPPATLAVRGRFLTGGLPNYSVCVSFDYFSSRFTRLHSQAVQRCGSGF